MTEYPDKALFSGIKSFQKDNNIKVDGVILPEGETESSLNNSIEVAGGSPIFRCTLCSAPHGGVFGSICPYCAAKT